MKLFSNSFHDNHPIPSEYAFCAPDKVNRVALSSNRNPHLSWSDIPAGTRSLALICHDPDVPSSGEDVNKEGRVISADLPRIDFYHWVLVDIPPDVREIADGAQSNAVLPRGKQGPQAGGPMRHGINDYTQWFADDAEMQGDYYGYDGPCPPWNDSIVHHYVFTLYALDVPRSPVEGRFRGSDVIAAIAQHVLESARLTGTYSLNQDVTG